MKQQREFKTKFFGRNPFSGEAVRNDRKPLSVEMLAIDDVPMVERAPQVNPLDDLFDRLKPGQRLRCPSGDEQRVKGAMERWLKRKGERGLYVIRASKRCNDGFGGVWMIKK